MTTEFRSPGSCPYGELADAERLLVTAAEYEAMGDPACAFEARRLRRIAEAELEDAQSRLSAVS